MLERVEQTPTAAIFLSDVLEYRTSPSNNKMPVLRLRYETCVYILQNHEIRVPVGTFRYVAGSLCIE